MWNKYVFVSPCYSNMRHYNLMFVSARRRIANQGNKCHMYMALLRTNRYSHIKSTYFLDSILPSPRHYSSGWALASWTIRLHSSLLLICPLHPFTFILRRWSYTSSNHLHLGLPVSVQSIHPRLTVWFLNSLVFTVRSLASRPTPILEDQGIPLRLAPTPWSDRHGWSYQ
jgi:hypothetical protein